MNIRKHLIQWPAQMKYLKWPGVILAATIFLALVGYFVIIFGGRLVVSEEELILDSMTTVVTKEGEVIEPIYTKNRKVVSISDIPEHVQNAFIAIEDARFYDHPGVDFKSVARAVYRDIVAMAKVEGGSTITQQVAKNLFLSNDKTWMRKTKEVMAAIYLERNFTKKEILELYLNRIYFGEGAYGVEAASTHYFGKSISDLTVSQGALLAGLPKAPNHYSPFDHPVEAKQRRDLVLSRMQDLGMLGTKEMIRMQGATLATTNEDQEEETWSNSYVDLVIKEAEEKYHISREELKRGGYRIIVEMDPEIQKIATRVMKNGEFVPGSRTGVEGALTLMDHSTGALVAVVGGRGFQHGDINRALTKHQPASLIKPLAVYGPALMDDHYHPYTLLLDKPHSFDGYSPENYDGQYEGKVSLYQALVDSKNVPAVWLTDQMGVGYSKQYLEKLGLKTKDQGLAIALGGLSRGYSPIQLTEAYSSFAQEGKLTESYTIEKIINRDGEVIHEHEPSERKVFNKQTAWYMTEMLQTTVQEGTASAGNYGKALAGKTGTQQHPSQSGNKDVWFAGYTPEYVGALWMGYDQSGDGYYLQGSSSYPTRLMKTILTKIDQHRDLKSKFSKPKGIKSLPEPIQLPTIKGLKGTLDLSGLAFLRGMLHWTPADDERIIYRIYRQEDGKDVKVGEVTGKGEYQVSAFGVFDQKVYYVVPYDPLTNREGDRSNRVSLEWEL